jgi:PAS domain S-box-containing protein
MNDNRPGTALHAAALAVSGSVGQAAFEELARFLSDILHADAAMISVYTGQDRTRMRTLATCLDGRLLRSFEYELASTPCAGLVGRDFRFVGSGASREFAPGTLFSAKGMDSYAAYALAAPDGTQLGLIAVMDREPLGDPPLVESMLKIFAVRAVAELERTRAEDSLRASEEQYRAIFTASEDAMVLWNSRMERVDVNPAYERLYGYSRAEVLEPGYGSLLPRPHLERRLEMLRRTLAGERCHAEVEAVRKSGERFEIEMRTIPVRYRGEPHVLAIGRDITARRRAEEALRASEEQYRSIFNATEDALVLRDPEFRIVDVNAAYERLSGYSRGEVVGVARVIANPGMDEQIRVLHARALAGEPFLI